MNLQFLPRSLMVFGAILAVLGGVFYLLDKHLLRKAFTQFFERTWSLYLITAVLLIISIFLTIIINGIWRS